MRTEKTVSVMLAVSRLVFEFSLAQQLVASLRLQLCRGLFLALIGIDEASAPGLSDTAFTETDSDNDGAISRGESDKLRTPGTGRSNVGGAPPGVDGLRRPAVI